MESFLQLLKAEPAYKRPFAIIVKAARSYKNVLNAIILRNDIVLRWCLAANVRNQNKTNHLSCPRSPIGLYCIAQAVFPKFTRDNLAILIIL